MEQLNTFLLKTNDAINYIILIFSRITWLEIWLAQIVLISIICYLIVLFILSKIHHKIYKNYINAQRDCTYQYDNLIYIIAKEESINKADTTVNPIEDILKTPNKNYLDNHDIIINAVRKLETDTKQILLSPEMEKTILALRKKIKNLNTVQKSFWIFLSIITIGIYLLFR
jgi:hypothetical protein